MDNSQRIGKCILDTAHQLKVTLDASFEDAALNGLQARILCFIEKKDTAGKCVYQRDIESEFKIRRSSVSSVLDIYQKSYGKNRAYQQNSTKTAFFYNVFFMGKRKKKKDYK